MNPRPDIILLFPDQLRGDWVLNPAVPVRTPNLALLAERGTMFTRAICPSPLCAPCRAALATACHYERCGVPDNDHNLPLERETLYRLLRESGYHTAGCGKFDLHKADYSWGTDGRHCMHEWGFADGIDCEGKFDGHDSGRERPAGPYMQYLEERGLRHVHVEDYNRRRREGGPAVFPTGLPDDAYCDNWIGRTGLELLDRAPTHAPRFLQVNFTGPHNPWDITESMTRDYAGVDFPLPATRGELDPDDLVAIRRNYAAMITNIDRWVGRYIEHARAAGRLERTVFVFASDHGEMLGNHGRFNKSVPHQPSVGVPLIVAGPGVAAGRRSDAPTTILDLAATFLDWAGVTPPDGIDAVSLRPLLEGRGAPPREVVFSGLNDWKLAFDGRFKFVAQPAGEALHDLQSDPEETRDVAQEQPEATERLRAALEGHRAALAAAPPPPTQADATEPGR